MAAPIEERFIEVDGIRIFLRERRGDGIADDLGPREPDRLAATGCRSSRRPTDRRSPSTCPGSGAPSGPAPGAFDYSIGAYGRLARRRVRRARAGRLPARRPRLGRRSALRRRAGAAGGGAAARRDQRRAADRDLPLALGRADLAPPRARRGLQPLALAAARRPAAAPRPRRPPADASRVRRPVLEHWDAGMSRAILALYRSADPDVLAAAGERLGEIRCPALVLWGDERPLHSAPRTGGPSRGPCRTPSSSSSRSAGPLAVDRPPRGRRRGRGLPRRRRRRPGCRSPASALQSVQSCPDR